MTWIQMLRTVEWVFLLRKIEASRGFFIRAILWAQLSKHAVRLVILVIITFRSNIFTEIFLYFDSTRLQIFDWICQFKFLIVSYSRNLIVFTIFRGIYLFSTPDWCMPIKISSLSAFVKQNLRMLRPFLDCMWRIFLFFWFPLVIIIRVTENILIGFFFFDIFWVFYWLFNWSFLF